MISLQCISVFNTFKNFLDNSKNPISITKTTFEKYLKYAQRTLRSQGIDPDYYLNKYGFGTQESLKDTLIRNEELFKSESYRLNYSKLKNLKADLYKSSEECYNKFSVITSPVKVTSPEWKPTDSYDVKELNQYNEIYIVRMNNTDYPPYAFLTDRVLREEGSTATSRDFTIRLKKAYAWLVHKNYKELSDVYLHCSPISYTKWIKVSDRRKMCCSKNEIDESKRVTESVFYIMESMIIKMKENQYLR